MAQMKLPISEQSKRYSRHLTFMLLSVPVLYFLTFASLAVSEDLSMFLFTLSVIILILGIFGKFGVWIADTAESKGRSWKAFFWLSILISPLITGLIVSSMRDEVSNTKSQAPRSVADELFKLESLQKSGAISAEEYKSAKAKILDN